MDRLRNLKEKRSHSCHQPYTKHLLLERGPGQAWLKGMALGADNRLGLSVIENCGRNGGPREYLACGKGQLSRSFEKALKHKSRLNQGNYCQVVKSACRGRNNKEMEKLIESRSWGPFVLSSHSAWS